MSSKNTLLEYLRKKAEELRRELEIVEELIRIIDMMGDKGEASEPQVIRERNGVRITIPKPIDKDSVEAEYLIARLNEILGKNYEVQRDLNGRIKAIKILETIDNRLVKEVKSVIKAAIGKH